MNVKRRNLVVVVAFVAMAIVLVWLLTPSSSSPTASETSLLSALLARFRGASPTADPSANGAGHHRLSTGVPLDAPPPIQEFEEARVEATATWRFQVENKLRECLEAPTGESVLPVGFTLVYDPRLSTEGVQRFVVQNVDLSGSSDPVKPAVRSCLNQAIGMTANLTVSPDEVPENQKLLREIVALPM